MAAGLCVGSQQAGWQVAEEKEKPDFTPGVEEVAGGGILIEDLDRQCTPSWV